MGGLGWNPLELQRPDSLSERSETVCIVVYILHISSNLACACRAAHLCQDSINNAISKLCPSSDLGGLDVDLSLSFLSDWRDDWLQTDLGIGLRDAEWCGYWAFILYIGMANSFPNSRPGLLTKPHHIIDRYWAVWHPRGRRDSLYRYSDTSGPHSFRNIYIRGTGSKIILAQGVGSRIQTPPAKTQQTCQRLQPTLLISILCTNPS